MKIPKRGSDPLRGFGEAGGMKHSVSTIYWWIAFGGGLGGLARYWIGIAAGIEHPLPFATLAVNAAGSFAIGCFATLTAPEGRWPLTSEIRQFFMTGFCGGFTTFSFFSLETIGLLDRGAPILAAAYVLATVSICLLFVWAGHRIAVRGNTRSSL